MHTTHTSCPGCTHPSLPPCLHHLPVRAITYVRTMMPCALCQCCQTQPHTLLARTASLTSLHLARSAYLHREAGLSYWQTSMLQAHAHWLRVEGSGTQGIEGGGGQQRGGMRSPQGWLKCRSCASHAIVGGSDGGDAPQVDAGSPSALPLQAGCITRRARHPKGPRRNACCGTDR